MQKSPVRIYIGKPAVDVFKTAFLHLKAVISVDADPYVLHGIDISQGGNGAEHKSQSM